MFNIEEIIKGKIFIAGPCSIESKEQVFRIARKAKESGANMIRAGAFKPRTWPQSFQGLGFQALDYLRELRLELDMPVVSEIVDPRHLEDFHDIDVLQVGARNMQNFELLKELGKTDQYVLLKRGMGSTVEEMLAASEYIMANGNERIILCERGIRTFENSTRYTMDLASVYVAKKLSPYKILVDPSHATGVAEYVGSAALAGIAAGADGLIIEVHDNPKVAMTDREQAITPEELEEIIRKAKEISRIIE